MLPDSLVHHPNPKLPALPRVICGQGTLASRLPVLVNGGPVGTGTPRSFLGGCPPKGQIRRVIRRYGVGVRLFRGQTRANAAERKVGPSEIVTLGLSKFSNVIMKEGYGDYSEKRRGKDGKVHTAGSARSTAIAKPDTIKALTVLSLH